MDIDKKNVTDDAINDMWYIFKLIIIAIAVWVIAIVLILIYK